MSTLNDAKRWSDGRRTLYQGDCRVLLPILHNQSFRSIISDPPYGEGVLDEGDDNPADSAELLREVLALAVPKVRAGGHVALWWSNRSLDRCIEAGKSAGLEYKRVVTMWVKQGNARPYLGWLPRCQPIVLFKVPGRIIPEWRREGCVALKAAMKGVGKNSSDVAKALGVSGRLVTKWHRLDDEAWSWPNNLHRERLRELLGVTLPPAPADNTAYKQDVYEVEGGGELAHPCQKPLGVVEDVCQRLGGPILDPFAGSATTLVAARRCGLEAVGMEMDPKHVRAARDRLAQQEMFV